VAAGAGERVEKAGVGPADGVSTLHGHVRGHSLPDRDRIACDRDRLVVTSGGSEGGAEGAVRHGEVPDVSPSLIRQLLSDVECFPSRFTASSRRPAADSVLTRLPSMPAKRGPAAERCRLGLPAMDLDNFARGREHFLRSPGVEKRERVLVELARGFSGREAPRRVLLTASELERARSGRHGVACTPHVAEYPCQHPNGVLKLEGLSSRFCGLALRKLHHPFSAADRLLCSTRSGQVVGERAKRRRK